MSLRAPFPFLPLLAVASGACMPAHDITAAPESTRSCPPAGGAVAWYFPTHAGDNTHLDRWCVTVGPIELETTPSADFGPFGPGDPVTVAVWNTDAGAGYLEAFLETEFGFTCDGRASMLPATAPHVVVLVQEALRRSNAIPDVPKSFVTPPPVKEEPHPGPRLGALEVARRCGLAFFYAPAARNDHRLRDGKREDKGNAILSTLPLSDPIVLELPFEAARRVVPMATIRSPDGDRLRLASVHLITTPPPWRALLTGGSSRLRQARGLVDALMLIERDRCAGTCAVATIIAGDLNTWSNRETTLRELRRSFPDSPPALAEPTRGPFPTDHLLFRRGGASVHLDADSYRRVDDAYYSDHHPIAATLRLGSAR